MGASEGDEGTSVSFQAGAWPPRGVGISILGLGPPLLQDPPLSTAPGAAGDPGRRSRRGGYCAYGLPPPPLSFSPLPSLPSGPALRGRAGRQPLPCAGGRPGFRGPGSRDCGRKAWVASGRPGASVNPVTPKVNRVKELFSFFNDQRGLPPPRPILTPVAGTELGGVCLARACETKE